MTETIVRKGILKGINFKQTPVKKILLIHPETFSAYLSTFPVVKGLVYMEFIKFAQLNERGMFAKVGPVYSFPEDIVIPNCRAINFVKHGQRLFVAVHLEMFNYFFFNKKEWVPFYFRYMTHSTTDFAEIQPMADIIEQRKTA
jgi:hypothetical protein